MLEKSFNTKHILVILELEKDINKNRSFITLTSRSSTYPNTLEQTKVNNLIIK